MDGYTEQVVKIKKTPVTIALRILLWIISVTSSVMFFLLGLSLYRLLAGTVTMLMFVFIFLVNYFAIIFNRKFNVEYEYIRTDQFLDVDRVNSGRTRERIASFNLREVEKIGKFTPETNLDVKKIFLCANVNDELMYFVFNHKKYGKSAVVISPDERLTEGLRFYIQKQVWFDAFGRY